MLMLTHTWIMREYLAATNSPAVEPELFAYNVIADILPIHRGITPEMTHGIERFGGGRNSDCRESAILFHLLVDDYSHYGLICRQVPNGFQTNPQGFAYLKGKQLISPVTELYRRAGREIEASLACYQSHILIEMAFDMVLCRKERLGSLLLPLYTGLRTILDGNFQKTSFFLAKVFGIDRATVSEAVEQAKQICTYDGMAAQLDTAGRAELCLRRFGVTPVDSESRQAMTALLEQATDLVTDQQELLTPLIKIIRGTDFQIDLRG